MFKNCGFFVVAFCLIFSIVTPLMAQEKTEQEVNDAELEKAAIAYREIFVISQKFEQSVQQTPNHKERQKLQEQANKKMAKAVEKSGLDIKRYKKIMKKVYEDEKVAKEFRFKMKDVSKTN